MAGQLGNTPAICQIHPRVLDAYRDGSPIRAHEHAVPRIRGLDREEVPRRGRRSERRGRVRNPTARSVGATATLGPSRGPLG